MFRIPLKGGFVEMNGLLKILFFSWLKSLCVVKISFWYVFWVISAELRKWKFLQRSIFFIIDTVNFSNRTHFLETNTWGISLNKLGLAECGWAAPIAGIKLDWGQLIFMILYKILFRLFAREVSFGSKPSGVGVRFLESGFLSVKFKGVFVIFEGLFKIFDFIKTGSPCQKGINVFRIQLNNDGEVLNGEFNLSNFLISAAH